MKRVLLLNMPFYGLHSPAIEISLLKAGLERHGLPCDVVYLNLAFTERLCEVEEGLVEKLNAFVDCLTIGSRTRSPSFLLADWLFSADLFGEPGSETGSDIEDLLAGSARHAIKPWTLGEDDMRAWIQRALRIRAQVAPFLDDCIERICWDDYDVIGFICNFFQLTASLALARRLKARHPDMTMLFGGPRCEQEMGEALHRVFPFVDVVCSGSADWMLPELVARVRGGADLASLSNLVFRRDRISCSTMRQAPLTGALDDLPYPDYSDYFSQLQQNPLSGLVKPLLAFETSRGCWWGQRSHCAFCGINGASLTYSSKSPERALAELTYLTDRYGVRDVYLTDSIMDMAYFRTLLPALKASQLGLRLFCETKANLTREQIRSLKEAGVEEIQPGIETLSTSILRLMHKGTTQLQNIQVLKWARELGVSVVWNLLVGFPGEEPAEYVRMAKLVPALVHLQPPTGCRWIRVDRFSPYFEQREAVGVSNVRPLEAYRCIFRLPDEDVAGLACFYDHDYIDNRDPRDYIGPLVEAVAAWQKRDQASLTYDRPSGAMVGDVLLIRDARQPAVTWIRLSGLQRAIYEFCDEAHSLPAIEDHARAACEAMRLPYATPPAAASLNPTLEGADVIEFEWLRRDKYSRSELERLLVELVDLRLMLCEDNRYLSLATCADAISPPAPAAEAAV